MYHLDDLNAFLNKIQSLKFYLGCFLIGSYATGTEDEDSDYDIRIVISEGVYGTGFDISSS